MSDKSHHLTYLTYNLFTKLAGTLNALKIILCQRHKTENDKTLDLNCLLEKDTVFK